MDTGAYMANQMDDSIENGIRLHEQLCNELSLNIEEYIHNKGFTWTLGEIMDCYRQHLDGNYISFTARQVVNHFKERLDKLYNP